MSLLLSENTRGLLQDDTEFENDHSISAHPLFAEINPNLVGEDLLDYYRYTGPILHPEAFPDANDKDVELAAKAVDIAEVVFSKVRVGEQVPEKFRGLENAYNNLMLLSKLISPSHWQRFIIRKLLLPTKFENVSSRNTARIIPGVVTSASSTSSIAA